jgi:hypothetical protein
MSYVRSRARKEFQDQLHSALAELTPLHQLAISNGSGPRLLAVYYVFAFSQLEVYVKTFVEDSLSTLNTAAPSLGALPDAMLGYLLHRGQNLAVDYKKFNAQEDERVILARLALAARKIVEWNTAGGVTNLRASDFLEKKKYPSPKNLPQLFKRLGIDSIFAVVSSTGSMNSELILTSLNDLRTGIAHDGRVPPGFSMSDFRDRLDQMQKFVAAMDRGVASFFCDSLIRRAMWNAAMR